MTASHTKGMLPSILGHMLQNMIFCELFGIPTTVILTPVQCYYDGCRSNTSCIFACIECYDRFLIFLLLITLLPIVLQVFGIAVDKKIKNAIFAFILSGVAAGGTALLSIMIKKW